MALRHTRLWQDCPQRRHFDHLAQADDFVTLTFFFDSIDTKKQKLDDMLRSFIFRLYSSHPESQKSLDSQFNSCDSGNSRSDPHALSAYLKSMMLASKKYIILSNAWKRAVEMERGLSQLLRTFKQ
ncbi:hypothetical protein ACQKWADRAFT_269677 [Trichoderma austrokoningii]